MAKKTRREVLDSIAALRVSHGLNLFPHVAERLYRRSLMQTLRTRPILVIALLVVIALLLNGVAYAIDRFVGYIPGFGFTSGSQAVLVLDAPISQTHNGITLRVDKVVSDGNRFWVEMTVSGYSYFEMQDHLDAYPNPDTGEYPPAHLVLPSGQKIQSFFGESPNLGAAEILFRYEFPPLKDAPVLLTLVVEKMGGETFIMPLQMRPIHQSEIVPAQPEATSLVQSVALNGLTFILEKVAQSSTETFFEFTVQADDPHLSLLSPWSVLVTDQHGNIYPLIVHTKSSVHFGDTKTYKSAPFRGDEQLTMRLVGEIFTRGKLPARYGYSISEQSPSFHFDPGSAPQVGQTWQLDETLHGKGFTLHLIGARVASEHEIIFEIEPSTNVTRVAFREEPPAEIWADAPTDGGNIQLRMGYRSLPNGPYEISLSTVEFMLEETWEINWTPQPAPQPSSDALLSTPTPDSVPEIYATPTLTSADPFLLEVEALSQKFNSQFETGPAWIHVIWEGGQYQTPGLPSYPPAYYTIEKWLEINKDGVIIRQLSTDRDVDEIILQQNVRVAGYGVNLTQGNGGTVSSESLQRFREDYVVDVLDRAFQNGQSVQHEETTCEGQPCWLIWMQSNVEPFRHPATQKMVIGNIQKIWMDLQIGKLIRSENIWLYEDGTEKIEAFYGLRIIEKLDSAPQEVLDIFSRIILP